MAWIERSYALQCAEMGWHILTIMMMKYKTNIKLMTMVFLMILKIWMYCFATHVYLIGKNAGHYQFYIKKKQYIFRMKIITFNTTNAKPYKVLKAIKLHI